MTAAEMEERGISQNVLTIPLINLDLGLRRSRTISAWPKGGRRQRQNGYGCLPGRDGVFLMRFTRKKSEADHERYD